MRLSFYANLCHSATRTYAIIYVLRADDIWSEFMGPVFRCALLVGTCCLDPSDDAVFNTACMQWSEHVVLNTLLLFRTAAGDDSFAAVFNRYSVVQEAVVGVHGQCSIPGCSREFPASQPSGWHCSFLPARPKNQKDVERIGSV